MENNKRLAKLETFNKLFMELLNDLHVIKPNDTTLLWVKTAVALLDTETLVSQFMDYVDEYSEKILNRDESFFVNELHKTVNEEGFAAREIKKVRSIWLDPKTTDDTKECIWKYFILLVKLGKSLVKN